MILRSQYDYAKQLYPGASEEQLWDMASSMFFVGNTTWEGGDTVNGNPGTGYKQDVDTLMAIMGGSMGQLPGQDPGSAESGAVIPPGKVTGVPIVDMAMQFVESQFVLGAPYGTAYQGQPTYFDEQGRPTAFDCSGFVSYLAKTQLGMDISTGSHEQWNDAGRFVDLSKESLQPGDLVFFDTGLSYRAGNNASHVGIFAGYDEQGRPMMVNALNENEGVVYIPMDSEYWSSRFLGAKRLVG
jgi:cell wall-associated NlpC family hydrolase